MEGVEAYEVDTMCTLTVLYKLLESHPIIALHNRYMKGDVFEYPPRVLKEFRFKVYCPIDLRSGGTWIGFNEKGLLVAVVDQHSHPGEEGQKRSRGVLILEILGSYCKAAEAREYLVGELGRGGYKRGNFVLLDYESGYHVVYEGGNNLFVREINRGLYVVTNLTPTPVTHIDNDYVRGVLERAEKRKARAEELGKAIVSRIERGELREIDGLLSTLMNVARDHAYGKSIYSICLHDNVWQTTSATIMAVGKDIGDSRVLYARGPPCESAFVDYSFLLRDMMEGEVALKSSKLLGKKIAVCLTGSVASIEAPKLARELRRHGAEVRAFMTKYAIAYGVSPKVMEWATRNKVVVELGGMSEHLAHYDLVVVYPATLNTIIKASLGIADNAVTTLIASTPPDRIIMVPAMNLKLYSNPLLGEALSKLRRLGVTVLEPYFEEGVAKVPSPEEVADVCIRVLSLSKLRGRRVLILAGATRYMLDAVRVLTTSSTGLLGYWLAREAFQRGCHVKMILGASLVEPPRYIPVIRVNTVEEMMAAAIEELRAQQYDYVISPAAILDFRPETRLDEKVPSTKSEWVVKLVPTPKVLEEIRARFPHVGIVAFKLEYRVTREVLVERALKLLEKLNALAVVANDAAKVGEQLHEVVIVDRNRNVTEYRGPKRGLASKVLDVIEGLLEVRAPST